MASSNIARLGVVLGMDTAEFTASVNKAIAENQKLSREIKRQSNAAEAEIIRLKHATDDYGKTLTQVELVQRQISSGAFMRASDRHKQDLLAQAAALDAIAASSKKAAGGMNAFQKQSLMYQTTDFFTQVASGQSVMIAAIQQGGQLKDTMGGLGNMFRMLAGFITPAAVAIASVVVVVGTAAYGFYAGSKEVHEFNKNLILTGNYAGTTYSQILSLSKGLSDDLNINLTTSRDAFFAVAASGQFTQTSLASVAESIGLISKISGMTAQEVSGKLIPVLDGSAASTKKLNDAYHFLTFSQYKQIEALADAGKKQEAIKLTTDLLNGSLKSQEENLGAILKLWNGLANVFSTIKSALLDIGRTDDAEAAIKRLNKEILSLTEKGTLPGSNLRYDKNTIAEEIESRRKEIAEYELKVKNAAEKAKSAQAAQKKIEGDVKGGGIGSEIKKAAENAKLEFEEKLKQREAYANEMGKIDIEAERQTFDAIAKFNQKQHDEQGARTTLNEQNLSLELTAIAIDRANKTDAYRKSILAKELEEFQKSENEKAAATIAKENEIYAWRISAEESFQQHVNKTKSSMNELMLRQQMIGASNLELQMALRHLETLKEIEAVQKNMLLDKQDQAVEIDRINRKEQMDMMLLTATDKFVKVKEMTDSVFGNMTSAIDNFVKTGKFAFKDFAASVIRDLIAIQMKAQATSLFSAGLKGLGIGVPSGAIGGGGGFGTGANFGNMDLGGFFADGGNPPVNQVSVVGERGPELFVPRSAGTIIPNNALASMGGGGQTINYNGPFIQSMSAIDTQSGLQFLAKNKQSVWSAYQSANRGIPMSR